VGGNETLQVGGVMSLSRTDKINQRRFARFATVSSLAGWWDEHRDFVTIEEITPIDNQIVGIYRNLVGGKLRDN
jgi:hypothetical protein